MEQGEKDKTVGEDGVRNGMERNCAKTERVKERNGSRNGTGQGTELRWERARN